MAMPGEIQNMILGFCPRQTLVSLCGVDTSFLALASSMLYCDVSIAQENLGYLFSKRVSSAAYDLLDNQDSSPSRRFRLLS